MYLNKISVLHEVETVLNFEFNTFMKSKSVKYIYCNCFFNFGQQSEQVFLSQQNGSRIVEI